MINYTKEEIAMIKNYATIMTGFKSGKKWRAMACETSIKIQELISLYKEDGYGDKPVEMNRVEYWLYHLKNEN
tara:strand:- start:443 stop:661 length:219 start_codon:yes stop_codon:yes gene_type:complete